MAMLPARSREDILHLRPQGPAEMLDSTLTLYLQAAGVFLGLSAAAVGIAQLARFLVLTASVLGGLTATSDPDTWHAIDSLTNWAAGYIGFGATAALTARAGVDLWWSGTTSMSRAVHKAPFGPTLGAIVLFGLPWLPIAAMVAVPWSEDGYYVLGLVLLFHVPVALTASLLMSLALAVIASERLTALRALRRSLQLFRRLQWARAIMTFLLAFLLLFIVGFALALGSSALLGVLPFLAGSLPNLAVGTLALFVFETIAASLLSLIPVVIYFDGRIRTEGLDVMLLLDAGTKATAQKRRGRKGARA